jgi:uncharacterized protein YgiM (DUF1202 family)
MKCILIYLFLGLTALAAQPNFSAVISAVKSGNVVTVNQYLDAYVDVTVGDKDGSYTKEQAAEVIQLFFAQNAPTQCSMVHSGAARDGASYYCIGNLSAGGNKFRIYIFFKKVAAVYLIQEMRFEED